MGDQQAFSESKSRPWLLALVALALGVVWIGLVLWGRLSMSTANASGPAAKESRIPFDPSTWAWRSEEHWAVDQMAKDACEMILFAAGENPEAYAIKTEFAAQPHAYLIRISGPKLPEPMAQPLVLHEFLWDPNDLAPLVHDLRARLNVAAGPAGTRLGDEALRQLLDPTPLSVAKAQEKVSSGLNGAPASADAHEAAGAVLTAFGLFDSSGSFQDHRMLLCRLAAHLALAAEFRTGAPGQAQTVSHLGILAMTSQSARAATELEALRQQPGSLPEAWWNAIFMRVTGDWRGAQDPAKASLAETLASYAGRCEFQSSKEGWSWIEPKLQGASPAFLHHVATAMHMSVEMGHVMTRMAIPSDLAELRSVQELKKSGLGLGQGEWIKPLNALPGRAYDAKTRRLEVIDWGAWAQRFQAALMDDMMRTIDFLANSYGSKPDLEQYLDRIERDFSGLDQFPVLQKRYANLRPSIYRAAIARAEQVARAHPESISDANWICLGESTPGGAPPPSMPHYAQWLSVVLPFGTSYNARERCWEMKEWRALPLEERRRRQAVDPYDFWLSRDCLEKEFGHGRPTPAAVESLYGPIKVYGRKLYLDWMEFAYPDASPEYLRLLQQETEIDPYANFRVGFALAERHRDAEALQAFLRGYQLDPGRVAVSNSMRWAVRQLFRTGQTAKAEAIAEECGDVSSAEGLKTLAMLREMQGRLQESEEQYRGIQERYGSEDEDIFGFYARNAGKDAHCKAEYESRMGRIFPSGYVKFDASREPAKPLKGVTLDHYPERVKEAGIHQGAVFVAVDGYKVENIPQYMAARSLSLEDDMTLVVFEEGQYKTLNLFVRNRRFGPGLKNFVGHP